MLTPKMEAFAAEYVRLGTATDAYRSAYDAEGMSSHVIRNESSKLLANRDVTVAIDAIRMPVREALQLSQEQIVLDLYGIFQSTSRDGVKVQALKEIADLLGYKVTKSISVNLDLDVDKIASMSAKWEQLSIADQELMREAQETIQRLVG
jgi:phage terminase small subunit